MKHSLQIGDSLKEGEKVVDQSYWAKLILDARHMPEDQLLQVYRISGSLILVVVLSVFSFLTSYL